MSLSNSQKTYIKRNVRRLSIPEIARDLKISEDEILRYLKKKWSKEKYNKFLSNRTDKTSVASALISSFNLWSFIRANQYILIFLVLLVLAVYFNSLGNSFVSDDIPAIVNNEKLGNFGNIFSESVLGSLRRLFYFFAFKIGGLNPLSYRIINLIFHLGSTFLVFTLLSLLSKRSIAIVAASIFAVHPILIESVTWISGGPYSQYSFFFLLSFLTYILSKNDQKLFYISIFSCVLSLLSSEKAMVLFLILALYEISFGSFKENWKRMSPFIVICITWIFIYLGKIGERVESLRMEHYQQSGGLINPLLQVPIAIASYLKLIFWPRKLTLYHTEMSFSAGQYALCLLTFILLAGAIIYSCKKNKVIFFWLSFFIITLLPTLTPFGISWIVAERYVYLGSLGIFAVIATLADKLTLRGENFRNAVYFALIIIIIALSARTIVRNMDWKNEDTLWIATAKVSPSGPNIHNNLGDVYSRQGDLNKAAEEFQKAIEIKPGYADAYHNLANTYQRMGRFDVAIENYQKAAELNPNLWQSHQALAAIYFEQEKYDLALDEIKKALEINPESEELKQNLQLIESKQ